MKITHRIHGIPFNRSGLCNRCGACHCDTINGDGSACIHFSWIDNLATCNIQDNKKLVCHICSNDPDSIFSDKFNPGNNVTHEFCENFPDHPFLLVAREKKCGYIWTRLDENGNFDPTPY